jgi:hypothetical protein
MHSTLRICIDFVGGQRRQRSAQAVSGDKDLVIGSRSTQASLPDLTDGLKRYLNPILTVAGYLLPGWVGETWLGTFGDEPVLFLIGLICVAATMLIGLSLEETIRSRAGEIWHASWHTVPKWAVDPKSTWLYKLRSNPTVIKAYRYFAWWVLPTIFLLACAGIMIWLWWEYREVDPACGRGAQLGLSRAIHGKKKDVALCGCSASAERSFTHRQFGSEKVTAG